MEPPRGAPDRRSAGDHAPARRRHGLLGVALVLAACGPQASLAPATPGATSGGGASPPSTPQLGADIVFLDGNVITIADAEPRAQAVAIDGDRIAAVGSNAEVEALIGPATTVVSLAGLTVTPGFIDAHQHRIGDGPDRLGIAAEELVDRAVAQGLTTIHELYVDEGRLAELVAMDEAGTLRLRVNAYLPVQENGAEGTLFGPYFDAWSPRQQVSPHVRVVGLKVFTDFDNANVLLWNQAELDAFVLEQHRKGWQLAIKTVAASSLEMIVAAVESMQAADPTAVDARVRLEHMLFATPDQVAAVAELGMVPAINLNMPGQGVGDPGIDDLVSRQPAGSYVPWRRLFDAGLPSAGISGFPSYHVDEPAGAPFGSPIHLIYQAVTRVGNLGVRSPDALLDQAISAEEALRALTINAAHAAFEDDVKGSIEVGKLADLVVLSADPLAVEADAINDIAVLATLVGGRVEHCAPGSEALCPPPGSGGEPNATAPGATPSTPGGSGIVIASVEASSELPQFPASQAVDGTDAHWNAVDAAPAWIELTLADPAALSGIELVVAQDPAGHSVHEVWIGVLGGEPELVHAFEGVTSDGDVLAFEPASPIADAAVVRIVTTELAGGLAPAWREITLLGVAH
jgi:predicted amidohydrolase YtcJ